MLKPKHKIYARNCELKEVSELDCKAFLNAYHLQNSCRNQEIRLGLYQDDKLVELMTFGMPRYNHRFQYELLRLCTESSYQVVGGSKKIWSNFLRLYHPYSVVSYCDRSKFSGEVYEHLGFLLADKGYPGKRWSKGKQVVNDTLLMSRGYDQIFGTNYGKGTSNEQLMLEHGWLPIYDCGQARYEWRNE